jgi:CubicO group peptidase (beta-lactamase class C family)
MQRFAINALVACSLFIPVRTSSQDISNVDISKRLDQVMEYHVERDHFMGTILVQRGDHSLLNKGYGFANLESKMPNTPDTEFALASITKQFTAVLILRLQEQGKLSVSEKLVKYVPEIPTGWAPVTIQELLNHTSGVPDISEDPRFDAFAMESHTLKDQLDFLHAKSLDFKPGTKFAYSNSNYFLLAMVAEAAAKQPFAAMLRQLVLTPAGLEHTYFDTDALIIPNRAQGYEFHEGGWQRTRIWSMSVGVGIGNLVSTSGDLQRWYQALFSGNLLRPETLQEMTRPGISTYGDGVFSGEINGERFVGHGGAVQGFFSDVDYLPKSDTTVVVLCNSEQIPSLIRAQLLDTVQGRPVTLPNEMPPLAPELSRFTGTYTAPADIAELPTIKVTRQGSTLSITRRARTSPAIFQGAEANRVRFAVPAIPDELVFLTDGSGNAIAIDTIWGRLSRHPE